MPIAADRVGCGVFVQHKVIVCIACLLKDCREQLPRYPPSVLPFLLRVRLRDEYVRKWIERVRLRGFMTGRIHK
jgi:hypothetical protein